MRSFILLSIIIILPLINQLCVAVTIEIPIRTDNSSEIPSHIVEELVVCENCHCNPFSKLSVYNIADGSITKTLTDENPPIIVDTVLKHEANSEIVWDWFSYVPSSIDKTNPTYIWVMTEGGNEDYIQNTNSVGSMVSNNTYRADALGLILMGASIPRSEIYVVAFDRRVFDESTEFYFRRPDLKINQMIDLLTSNLRAAGYNIQAKVIVEGFSNAGMFAQRYSLLHPGKVKGVIGGQCGGSITLPFSSYNKIALNWAVGTNDFKTLTGLDFNWNSYKDIPQFIYVGDQDTLPINDHLHYSPYFWTEELLDYVNTTFGDTCPVRLQNMCNHAIKLGCNIEFKLYQGLGHDTNYDTIDDVDRFIAELIDNCPNDPIKTQPGICGCGILETDSDDDGTPDCIDTDSDNDGISDANDNSGDSGGGSGGNGGCYIDALNQ